MAASSCLGCPKLGLVWYLVSDTTFRHFAGSSLGRSALAQALQQGQRSIRTYYDAHWTPLVREIGNDLVQTLSKSCRRKRTSSDDDDLLCRFSQQRDWNFALVKEPNTVNAFCFPAGTIRITTGLMQTLAPSRGELAALLGHEMGHVLGTYTQNSHALK